MKDTSGQHGKIKRHPKITSVLTSLETDMDRSIKTIWKRTFTHHLKMKPSYTICHANQLIRVYQDGTPKRRRDNHRENGGTLGMVPLIINPIYTLYSGYLLGISPFKGLQQLGYHPNVQTNFPHETMTTIHFQVSDLLGLLPSTASCLIQSRHRGSTLNEGIHHKTWMSKK